MINLLLLEDKELKPLKDLGFCSEWGALLSLDKGSREKALSLFVQQVEQRLEAWDKDPKNENDKCLLRTIIDMMPSFMERDTIVKADNSNIRLSNNIVVIYSDADIMNLVLSTVANCSNKKLGQYLWLLFDQKLIIDCIFVVCRQMNCSDLLRHFISYKQKTEADIKRQIFLKKNKQTVKDINRINSINIAKVWLNYGNENNEDFVVRFFSYWIAFEYMVDKHVNNANEMAMREKITAFCASHINELDIGFLDRKDLDVFMQKEVTCKSYKGSTFDIWMSLRRGSAIALFQTMYSVRCNLVHGAKDARNQRDIELMKSSANILHSYLTRLCNSDSNGQLGGTRDFC